MNDSSEIRCGWCKNSATDPAHWMHFRSKRLPLCAECALNIKQVLKVSNRLARMVGQKLREQR